MVQVHRSEDEVFNKTAIASFESKPVTDEHPTDNVIADNVNRLLKGVCQNVRRGTGEDSDKLMADLVIYDPALKDEILVRRKREVSCGYNHDFDIDEEGHIHQLNIRGNHVAVVTAGRAGSDVAIHDNALAIPELPEEAATPEAQNFYFNSRRRKPQMSKNKNKSTKSGILGKMFSLMSKDAEPEEVAEVIEAIADALDTNPDDEAAIPEAPVAEKKDEATADAPLEEQTPHWAKDLLDRLDSVEDCVKALQKSDDLDPLEELEKELADEVGDDGEEAVEAAAEILGDESSEDESEDEDPMGTGVHQNDNRAQALAAIRVAKPAIAAIKDPKQRKTVSDSFAKVMRSSLGITGGKKGMSYSSLLDAKQEAAKKHKSNDQSTAAKQERAEKLGMEIAQSRNPHYMNKK